MARYRTKTAEEIDFYGWLIERGIAPSSARRYSGAVAAWRASGLEIDPFLATKNKSGRNLPLVAIRQWHKWQKLDIPEHQTIRGYSPNIPMYATPAMIRGVLSFVKENAAPRYYMAACLAYYAGLRVNEINTLEIDNVNLSSRTIRVLNSKRGKNRNVPIVKDLDPIIRRWVGFSRPQDKGERVLPLFSTSRFTEIMNQALTHCGLANAHNRPAHYLRHMFGTHAYERGATLMDLAVLMGHDSINTTQIYVHMAQGRLRHILEQEPEAIPEEKIG